MGATTFINKASGSNAREAFANARRTAQASDDWADEDGGYSGTIVEKDRFIMYNLPNSETPREYAAKLMDDPSSAVFDKWGPAGCIDLKDGTYLFFGWASD